MRSCERRIFDADTICIARVILRVFSTLRIFVRISWPAILSPRVEALDPRSWVRGLQGYDGGLAGRDGTLVAHPRLEQRVDDREHDRPDEDTDHTKSQQTADH